jgi:outer membrane immunogenic protein
MNVKSVIMACLTGCGLALTSMTPLHAADIYPTPKYAPAPYIPLLTFQGFYIGGHIGGAWGDISGQSGNFFFPTAPATPFAFREGDLSGSGVFGGLQAGYNFQSGPWVYGLELDIGGMGALSNNRDLHVVGPVGNFADLRNNGGAGWYGDLTGRLGYAFGPAMLYAKGGFAWAAPNLSASEARTVTGVTTVFGNNNNNTLTGWTAGGGLEYLISPNWSFKVEYLFFDFSNNNNGCCFDGTNNFRFFDRDLQVNTVKVGFNYFFHPDVVPLK